MGLKEDLLRGIYAYGFTSPDLPSLLINFISRLSQDLKDLQQFNSVLSSQ
jgi:hypothetical protein